MVPTRWPSSFAFERAHPPSRWHLRGASEGWSYSMSLRSSSVAGIFRKSKSSAAFRYHPRPTTFLTAVPDGVAASIFRTPPTHAGRRTRHPSCGVGAISFQWPAM